MTVPPKTHDISADGTRHAGVVLHPSSLPGPHGIGQIGGHARRFVRDLRAMGCDTWQVLPLGPTSYGDSPYSCLSSFAGNPLLIDLDDLVRDGLLAAADLADPPAHDPCAVDFGTVIHHNGALLRKAAEGFAAHADADLKAALGAFRLAAADWLPDYALFAALKDAHGGRAWPEWPEALVRREPEALARARKAHAAAVDRHEVLQFLFWRQWRNLRAFCAEQGVRIMGDMPIFTAHDSADVWADADLFHLDAQGYPTVVAGVPPDYFSETGQRWGNPLYRWDVMKQRGYAWWCRRLSTLLGLVDLVRIDHFRGFESYWEIRADEETAINGRWVPGPGAALFHAFTRKLGPVPIIAEDLGVITDAVDALRDSLKLPGMKVLQFILGNAEPEQLPADFPVRSVCYTGTHDNDTTVGWFAQAGDGEREAVCRHLHTDGSRIHAAFLHAAWQAPSFLAVAPMQDVLGLGSDSRLNLPGRPGGNWRWRFEQARLTPEVIADMHALSRAAGRLHEAAPPKH